MLKIRHEAPGDRHQVRDLLVAAFGGSGEAGLVDRLRENGALTLSLVAELSGRIAGHCALSHLKSPERSLALAPVAVMPDLQRRGIGMKLVERALALAKERGCTLVFVLGDPTYYGRFGFSVEAARPFSSPLAGDHFMALRLSEADVEVSPVVYDQAFEDLG